MWLFTFNLSNSNKNLSLSPKLPFSSTTMITCNVSYLCLREREEENALYDCKLIILISYETEFTSLLAIQVIIQNLLTCTKVANKVSKQF